MVVVAGIVGDKPGGGGGNVGMGKSQEGLRVLGSGRCRIRQCDY